MANRKKLDAAATKLQEETSATLEALESNYGTETAKTVSHLLKTLITGVSVSKAFAMLKENAEFDLMSKDELEEIIASMTAEQVIMVKMLCKKAYSLTDEQTDEAYDLAIDVITRMKDGVNNVSL